MYEEAFLFMYFGFDFSRNDQDWKKKRKRKREMRALNARDSKQSRELLKQEALNEAGQVHMFSWTSRL